MKRIVRIPILVLVLGISASAVRAQSSSLADHDGNACGPYMVPVGSICIDKYEASVWSKPPKSDGRPRGTQYGVDGPDYPCSVNGNDCSGTNPIYAASVPGLVPSSEITWFQAAQACANVGKRLPTNAEWQTAAAGTPDPGDDGVTTCNTDDLAPGLTATGSRKSCVSNWGAYDMVGNVLEWVADWFEGSDDPFAPSNGTAGDDFGDDFMVGVNPTQNQGSGTNFPAALVRGGRYNGGTGAGVFSLNAHFAPSNAADGSGFRCAR
jgi:formylglycine-generating enzyme required for sulfatase activity